MNDLSDYLQAGAIVINTVLAGATFLMVRATRATSQATRIAAEATGRQAEATAATAEAAAAQARHALAASIDAHSPVIVPCPDVPNWPPLQPASTPGGWASLPPDATFDLLNGGHVELRIGYQVLLRNEGSVSAVVSGFTNAEFVDETTRSSRLEFGYPRGERVDNLVVPIHLGGGRHVIPPGKEAVLSTSTGKTVAEWAEHFDRTSAGEELSAGSFSLVVGTQFDDTAIDNILLIMRGCPLVPVEGSTERWQLADASVGGGGPMTIEVKPVERRYFTSRQSNQRLEVGSGPLELPSSVQPGS